jgi:hypothetical protein
MISLNANFVYFLRFVAFSWLENDESMHRLAEGVTCEEEEKER